MEKKMVVDYAHEKWEKKFGTDAAYEKWDKKNKSKGTDNYFDTESRAKKSYLKGLKGRVQNNLSGLLRVVVTALIVLLQILLILILPFLLRSITVYFYFILELCSIIAIVTLVNKKQSPSFRIAWISIVLLLPISGFVLYYLWGREGGKKKQLDEHILRQISYGQNFLIQDGKTAEEYVEKHPVAGRMVKYMISEGFPLTAGNDVKYYPMGEDAFEDIMEALEQAKEYIFIDFFIVAEGALWDQIHKILKRKLEEGVEVKFLYDDFGAAIRTQKFFKQILEHEGMEVRVFNPIHKDTGVRLKGETVWNLTVVFLQMWEASAFEKEHIDYLRYKKLPDKAGDTYCQVIADGPAFNPNNSIESVYNQMITFADEYLYITTPYLVLEDYMQQSLIEAVHRGVDVRILTPYIPDKKYAKLLTNYNYGILLREGIRIYEYTPGFIHAKQILSENAAIVGTINMDYRSFYLHYENGVWMSGKKIQEDIRQDFAYLFETCEEISYESWKHRPRRWKLIQPILDLFSTLF